MKFSYSNKRLCVNLLLGIIWFAIGIADFTSEDENMKWKPYVLIILGIIYLLLFCYDFSQKYFEITKDKIKINSIPSKEISITEIREATYFANEYIFKSTNKTVKIVKSQINKKQLPEFEKFFNSLELGLQKYKA